MKQICSLFIVLCCSLTASERIASGVTVLGDQFWQDKLAARFKTDNPKRVHREEAIPFRPLKFEWEGGEKPYTLQIALNEDFSDSAEITVSENHAVVHNLFRSKKYFWKVSDHTGKVLSQGSFVTGSDPRWIRFPEPDKAPINFRDIGGYAAVDKKQVKQGMIYRGADLEGWRKISKINWQYLTDTLKIKSEIDFRYPRNVKDKVNSRLGKKVKYFFRPVNAYKSFTPEQNIMFRDTVRLFADKTLYPVYMHCSGGVDRTGEIAFLINGLLGVPEEKLFEDYEISSLSIFPRHRNLDYFRKWRETIAAYAPRGANVQKQIECYLQAIGVSKEEIAAIRDILLEDK
jgi:hypothetical protein